MLALRRSCTVTVLAAEAIFLLFVDAVVDDVLESLLGRSGGATLAQLISAINQLLRYESE